MSTYTLAAVVPEAPELVFRLITLPKLHSRWSSGHNAAAINGPTYTAGQRWTEQRRGILFLRPVVHVEVLSCSLQTRTFTTRIDDGLNVIVTQLQVDPALPADGASSSTIMQTVEAFTRSSSGRLLPSEKLAAMWLKHDKTLCHCVEYLQPGGVDGPGAEGSPRATAAVRLSSSLWGGQLLEAELVPAATAVFAAV